MYAPAKSGGHFGGGVMDKTLVAIFGDLEKKIEKLDVKESKKAGFQRDVKYVIENYRNLTISDNHTAVYDSLVKRGKELLKEFNNSKESVGKLDTFLRYAIAALYDIKGETKPLTTLVRNYLISCALFMALAPQYFSYILPLVLFVPMFMGLKGMKKRTMNGLKLAMTSMPMAVLTASIWIRNGILNMGNFDAHVVEMAKQMNSSIGFARNLTITFTVLSVVLFVSSIYTIYSGWKYRKMFL
jgi:uncharacterized membrane protein (DUF485 family)